MLILLILTLLPLTLSYFAFFIARLRHWCRFILIFAPFSILLLIFHYLLPQPHFLLLTPYWYYFRRHYAIIIFIFICRHAFLHFHYPFHCRFHDGAAIISFAAFAIFHYDSHFIISFHCLFLSDAIIISWCRFHYFHFISDISFILFHIISIALFCFHFICHTFSFHFRLIAMLILFAPEPLIKLVDATLMAPLLFAKRLYAAALLLSWCRDISSAMPLLTIAMPPWYACCCYC